MAEQIFNSSGTFNVPAGVTEITVEAWGGGGAGNGTLGGGGGGGAYAKKTITVTPEAAYDVVVGAGGPNTDSGVGANGGDSYFDDGSELLAKGGQGGQDFGIGLGGQASASVGDVKFSGGDGGAQTANGSFPNDYAGGGGGGAAGTTEDGANGQDGQGPGVTGGTGGAGGDVDGGAGGDGGDGGGASNGDVGTAPGGGGGGCGGNDFGGLGDGGAGADGRVRITWTPPVYKISGTVTLSGSPVENATVRCVRQSDNVAIAAQTTDSSGEYEFSGLESDELYHLAVEYEAESTKYNALSLWDIVPVMVS